MNQSAKGTGTILVEHYLGWNFELESHKYTFPVFVLELKLDRIKYHKIICSNFKIAVLIVASKIKVTVQERKWT